MTLKTFLGEAELETGATKPWFITSVADSIKHICPLFIYFFRVLLTRLSISCSIIFTPFIHGAGLKFRTNEKFLKGLRATINFFCVFSKRF